MIRCSGWGLLGRSRVPITLMSKMRKSGMPYLDVSVIVDSNVVVMGLFLGVDYQHKTPLSPGV